MPAAEQDEIMMTKSIVISTIQKADYLLGPDFAKELRSHAERHSIFLDRLEKASALGDQRRARTEQIRILKSYSSRLVCLVRCAERKDEFTPETIAQVAQSLNPWADPQESISAWAEPKSSGEGWRPICSFGPKRRALHMLCGDIITARFGTEDVDFLRKGRGSDYASDHINNLIEEKEYEFFVLADVKEFYRSVQQGSLQEALGLPRAVVTHCILVAPDAHLSLIGDLPINTTIETFDGAVRQGLPQGSRASNLIAGLLLGPALREIASADRIIVHGDDIAIAARNGEGAESLKKALSGVLESHPAGPFQLKRCEVHHVNDGFDFLKYRHKRDWLTGKVHRRPASKSYWRYTLRVVDIARAEPIDEGIRRVARYRRNWMRSFPRWRWNSISKLLLWLTTGEALKKGIRLKSDAIGKSP
jgi:hypothetical protein